LPYGVGLGGYREMHLKVPSFLATFLLGLLVFTMPVVAQLDRATLNGTVTDPSGAVLAGAKVTAVHAASGLVRTALTEGGTYIMPQLPIGMYTLTIEAEGFQAIKFEKVELLVGQNRTVDAELQIATTRLQVEVRDTVVALDRSSAEIGSVVQSSQVAGLPINGRNWASLMVLAPGAVNTGEGFQDDVRFAGRANDDNNWTFDGVDNTAIKDPTYGTGARLVVSMDSIAEFKVSSSLYSAEGGGGMGGQVNLVSKSGSNTFHGGLFEYFRNNALDARTVFDGPKLSPFRLNQFGGNIGGPIKANKLFFFGNYEGLRQRQGSVYTYNVPSPALRTKVIAGAPALKSLIDSYPLGSRTTTTRMWMNWCNPGRRRATRTASWAAGLPDQRPDDIIWQVQRNKALLSGPGACGPIGSTLSSAYEESDAQLQRTFSPSVVNETRFGLHRVPRIEADFGPFSRRSMCPGLTSLPNQGGQKEMEHRFRSSTI